jgi:hypothetical protein
VAFQGSESGYHIGIEILRAEGVKSVLAKTAENALPSKIGTQNIEEFSVIAAV